MSTEFDGDVGVFVEQFHQLVEGCGGFRAQCRLVEIIEDIVDKHWGGDRGKRELQCIFLRFLHWFHLQRLRVIEIALACTEDGILHPWFYLLFKRTVTLHTYFYVCPVVTYHIYQGLRQFISILLIHPSLHRLYYLGIYKRVDMIPSAGIATIRREEAPVKQSLESHSEVIALRVERVSGMLYRPGLLARNPDIGIGFCDEDVESSH